MPAVAIPKVLLPQNIDMSKWAVVACDQFSAEPAYWSELKNYIGDAPSALNLIFPEVFLNGDPSMRINNIHSEMNKYVAQELFTEVEGIILVEREVGDEVRVGLMVNIDLDAYDWRRVNVPVRATEDTIIDRLPVRVDIRRGAQVELPHTLILMDDCERSIIEPIYNRRDSLKKLYDFSLNMGGGRVRGYLVDNPQAVIAKIDALGDPDLQIERYGCNTGINLAVGDGNHSIASAKAYWEEVKPTLSDKEQETHPARYSLAEIVNLYGGGMAFEPIHRAVFGADEEFIRTLEAHLKDEGGTLTVITQEGERTISAPRTASTAIKAVQECLEAELAKNKSLKADYIHNQGRLSEVIGRKGGVGIVMPAFPAEELFGYVVNIGNLPKKAFSIGEPEHKRYYLETRRIK
ncbi:MAG: DUF1015 domain-containing protein [Clostridia bacterium]